MNDEVVNSDMHALVRACEMVGERWSSATCPVYVESGKRNVTANGVGTMFVGSSNGRLFLVTAHHVLDDTKSKPFRIANVQGVVVDTARMVFHQDTVADVALIELNATTVPMLTGRTLKHVPLDEEVAAWTPTGIFSLVGYPASRNVLKARFGSTNRHVYNLIATKVIAPSKRSTIPGALALEYSPREATTGNGGRITPPDLHGMSGGLCIEVMLKQSDGELIFRPRLRGVITEYHPQDRQIIVSPSTWVSELASGVAKA